MLNLDLEPLKELYQEILNTQALSEEELKNLAILIKKLQESKEELDNSSFTIVNKNTEILNQSKTILVNIKSLSNELYSLKQKINAEKSNFDKNIENKFNQLINNIKSYSRNILTSIENEKYNIENKLKDTKKVISREGKELEIVREQYKKKLESSLNEFREKLEEYDAEIEHLTFFKRWGVVLIGTGIGVLIGIIILFAIFKQDILFSLKYSDTCYQDNNQTYKCYVIPKNSNVVAISSGNSSYLIGK